MDPGRATAGAPMAVAPCPLTRPGLALDSHLFAPSPSSPSIVLGSWMHRLAGLSHPGRSTRGFQCTREPTSVDLAIGPLFAALAGIGFKEFFCFRRPEAIGLTLLLPVALLGHLSGLLAGPAAISMLAICSALLVVLALRKFGMEAAADVGDKSVFAYLENLRKAKST